MSAARENLSKMRYFTLFLVLLVGSTNILAQSSPAPVPGNVRLLPGYEHWEGRTIDSINGRIFKPHGLTIRYDMGMNAGHYELQPKWSEHALWRTEQIINGKKAVCIFTKSKELLVAFPDELANFYAEIHSQQDLADMMLMVLTYRSSH
jgi:hypothetical protein